MLPRTTPHTYAAPGRAGNAGDRACYSYCAPTELGEDGGVAGDKPQEAGLEVGEKRRTAEDAENAEGISRGRKG